MTALPENVRGAPGLWQRISLSPLALLAAAALPVGLVLGVLSIMLDAQIRNSKEVELLGVLRAISAAADAELNANLRFAEALAATENLARRDYERFGDGMRRVVATQPQLASIVVTDLVSGRYVVHTAVERGVVAPAGNTAMRESRIVAEARHSMIFGLRATGPTVSDPLIPIRAPVLRDDGVSEVLTLGYKSEGLGRIFERAGYNPQWTGAIIDPSFIIAARNRSAESYIGQKVSPGLEAALRRGATGMFASANLEGQKVYGVIVHSAVPGWSVAGAIPAEEIDGPRHRMLAWLLGVGGTGIAGGIGVALAIASRIRRVRRAETDLAQRMTQLVDERTSALRRNEERLRGVLDNITDVVLTADATGVIESANPAVETVFGRTAADVVGRELATLGIESERGRRGALSSFADPAWAGIVGRGSRIVTARRGDGATVLLELTVVEIPSLEAPRRFVIVLRDITRRRSMEEQLAQSQKMESIGQLTGGIAHDFNNLLGVVSGNLELLGDDLPQDSSQQPLVERALAAVDRGVGLTRNLLVFARRQPLNPRPTDANRLIADLVDLFRRPLGENIDVRTSLAPELWLCEVDAGQLEAAVLNLLVNARDAMPDGGRLTVETANVHVDDEALAETLSLESGDYVFIAVSDTGKGMSADVLRHAFEPFYTTKGIGRGTGLGLAMVYGFVTQSRGQARIYSEVGKGSTVKIYLPRAESPRADDAAADSADTDAAGRGETILVVEDDDDFRQAVTAMLTMAGYKVVGAATGDEGLAWLQGHTIDLLLTDIILPGTMKGHELARAAAQGQPGLKAVFMSGYTENAFADGAFTSFKVTLLHKPFRRIDLLRTIRAVLDKGAGAVR